jgi:DNA-binding XRE family transcriptional regulator
MVRAASPPRVAEVRRSLGLSRERMAHLFEVSAKTIERWEARGTPPESPHARRRLSQLQEIAQLGHIVYTPAGFHYFLTAPMPVFGGRTALQMIELGEGDAVFAALAADYEGSGF